MVFISIFVQAKPPPASSLGDSTFGKYTFYRLMCDVLGFLPTLFSCLCVQPYLLASTAVRILSASFVE